jgi:hypothetical protein
MRDETNIDCRKALATSGAALSLALPRRNLLTGIGAAAIGGVAVSLLGQAAPVQAQEG